MPLLKFGLVGLFNTAVGLAIIFAALAAGIGDYPANALGYGAGLVVSYTVNRRWTFAAKSPATINEFARFVACFGVAYAANLLVIDGFRIMGLVGNPAVHLAGMAVYSVLFFVLSRQFTFAVARRNGVAPALRGTIPVLIIGALAIVSFVVLSGKMG